MNKNIIQYISKDGDIQMQVIFEKDFAWITQKQLAEVFGVTRPNITMHLQDIFETEELEENTCCKDFLLHLPDGRSYNTKHYNLEVLISLGFRVHSKQATEFRKWANKVLKEFTTNGIVINEKVVTDKDKFNAAVDRLNDIRVGESNIQREITDIAKEICIDYDSKSDVINKIFATIQNRLHYAVTGMVAAEIIRSRADGTKENMGMTTRLHIDKDLSLRDATVAKNYYQLMESGKLRSLVIIFLESLKVKFMNGKAVYMKDIVDKLDEIIQSNDFNTWVEKYRITKKTADNYAAIQYNIYKKSLDKE